MPRLLARRPQPQAPRWCRSTCRRLRPRVARALLRRGCPLRSRSCWRGRRPGLRTERGSNARPLHRNTATHSHPPWRHLAPAPSPSAQDARGPQDETGPVAAAQGEATERRAPPLGGDAVERAQLVHELEARSSWTSHSATEEGPGCSVPRRASSRGRGRHRQAQPARNDAAQMVRRPLRQAGQVRAGLLGAKRRQGQSLHLRRCKVHLLGGQVVVQRYWRRRHAGARRRPEAAVGPGEAKRQARAPKQQGEGEE